MHESTTVYVDCLPRDKVGFRGSQKNYSSDQIFRNFLTLDAPLSRRILGSLRGIPAIGHEGFHSFRLGEARPAEVKSTHLLNSKITRLDFSVLLQFLWLGLMNNDSLVHYISHVSYLEREG